MADKIVNKFDLLELLICGYGREQSVEIPYEIAQCWMLYFEGHEGIPSSDGEMEDEDNNDNDAPIAPQEIVKNPPKHTYEDLLAGIRPQYYSNENDIPTRTQFKHEMKIIYNVPNVMICKAYKYILKQRAQCKQRRGLRGRYQFIPDGSKKYDALEFSANICVYDQYMKSWINDVCPRFNDMVMLHCWLDDMAKIQMIQKYAKQYIDKENESFIIGIINYELKNKCNNMLYGIIYIDKNVKTGDDKRYKVKTLMTKQQIHKEFGINNDDLPNESRPKISKQDLDKMRWTNLKIYPSQITTNSDQQNKSVDITTNLLREYVNIELERMKSRNNQKTKELIPIMAIDRKSNYYDIDWVLIVHIIHCNCDIGVSFRFNESENMFMPTAIYLDKAEIESKHKLIGLKYNYCKNIPSFSLKQLTLNTN